VVISLYWYKDKSVVTFLIRSISRNERGEWVLCPHSYGNGFYVHILTGMGNGFISDPFSDRRERPLIDTDT